jgi:hypothetical protein
VLVVAATALLNPKSPSPTAACVYELLTGHSEGKQGEVVFLTDLTVLTMEMLRPASRHLDALGVDREQVGQAVMGCWRDGEITGLQVDDLSFEEALSLSRPGMIYVRSRLRGRLTARLGRAYQRWLHPTSGRRPDDRFLWRSRPGAGQGGCSTLSSVVRTRTATPDGSAELSLRVRRSSTAVCLSGEVFTPGAN